MPDISVLMPIYNASSYPPEWLGRALQSVHGCEICAVDDCSQDDTYGWLMSLDKIKVGKTEKNTGGADACNIAASMATGKYFILLSCRSWYEAGSLEKMARYLDRHPEIGLVYGRTQFHDDKRFGGDWLKTPPAFRADDFKRAFMSSFGYMYRREAFDNGCRYGCTVYIEEENKYTTIADYDFVMQLIFNLGWQGYCLQDTTALHYQFGGKQMNDLLVKYRPQLKAEFNRLWA